MADFRAEVTPKTHMDQFTDMDTIDPRTTIIPTAEQLWLAARTHSIAQEKASLHAIHLRELLRTNIMPVEFLGADKIQCYYATNNGCLSNKMVEIIRENALKIATQVLTELDVLAAQEERKAANYLCQITKIYADKDDVSFQTSKENLDRVLSYFKNSESARLESLALREKAQQPKTEAEMTDLICQIENQQHSNKVKGRKRARFAESSFTSPRHRLQKQ